MTSKVPWFKVAISSAAAVAVQIATVIFAVFIYSLVRPVHWSNPASMAPTFGLWVGPISGLISTFAIAFLIAKVTRVPVVTGLLIGIGSSFVDASSGVLLFQEPFQFQDLYFLGLRAVAGVVGGWAACREMVIQRIMTVQGSTSQLWRCLTELELLKLWITQLVDEQVEGSITTGVGTRSQLTMQEGNKHVVYQSQVTKWEPETQLALTLSGGSFASGMTMTLNYELSNVSDQKTMLHYHATLPLVGLFRLLLPMIYLASLLNLRRDLNRLAKLVPAVGS